MENHEHPLFIEHVELLLRQIRASSYTIATVRDSLFDPVSVERRGDILIATEDLVNEAMTLAMEVRALAWPDKQPMPNTTAGNE